ncbi:RND transporter [Sphingomonas sp. ABOLE]|uniref:efflux transporter outer membrane subunit n=1 Tax=Sphingomonas sp. ABOLE TaxID=1985878 RepID=UPI000F7DAE14|nr:efflux transporter outer membrane subunit [Sphingomonas sp. ABOLE]RSV40834.1 RND transporter [Sphingomonas sp. ABOLE]
MKRAGGLAALLLLHACAGPQHPAPSDAAVTIPAGWRGGGGAGPVAADWWRGFHDPALDALVARALAGNLDLRIAVTRIEQARAQLRGTAAVAQPSAALGATGGTSRSLNPFGIGVDQQRGQGELDLAYEVDLFGRLSQSTQAARDAWLASQDARDALRIVLIATVVEAYLNLRAADARLAIVRQTVEERRQERDLIGRRFHAGYASRLEDQQAEAALEAAARLVPSTLLARTVQEDALAQLLGIPPTDIVSAGEAVAGVPDVPAALPSEVVRQRPDIAAAERRLAAADHRLAAARAAFLPRLQLAGSAGGVASTVLADPVSLFALGGSVLAPLFQGGALRAGRDAAAARRDAAAYAYKAAVLQAFREVEDAMASVRYVTEETAAAQQQVAALEQAYRAARRRYQAGYASYLEQLDAERALLAGRLDASDLRFRRLAAIAGLNRSIGGGWTEAGAGGEGGTSRPAEKAIGGVSTPAAQAIDLATPPNS